jgi:hypothetical protein
LEQLVKEKNTYLSEHPRASVAVAQRNVKAKWEKLRLPAVDIRVDGVKVEDTNAAESKKKDVKPDAAKSEDTPSNDVTGVGRTILLSKQQAVWEASSELDGCYCLKTDLPQETATKETIHDRYKDLSQVEWAFRMSKTVHLEARPIYVRLATRTRGHLLVLMLGYLLVQELSRCWRSLELTVEEGMNELKSLCTTEVVVKGKSLLHNIPEPRESVAELLAAAQIELPRKIASRGVHVSTRKKLTEERKTA